MDYQKIETRLEAVRERIVAACRRSGRNSEDVTIIAVTKTHPPAAVEAVRAVGIEDVGENRVQELEAKVDSIGREAVRWHLIGRLQRNKARRALELADMIHSVDSERLARKVSDEAVASGREARVLIQVNTSGEETKAGIGAEAALPSIEAICALPGLRVEGLMTMAPFDAEERVVRDVFSRTRRLAESAAQSVAGFDYKHLSMGMSGDFEIAVEEGSTLVRLGTILLGERPQA